MPEEVITWTAAGRQAKATAEVDRYGPAARTMRAGLFIGGGLLGGGACIIVPVLHLITTWALPLLGIVLGARAYKTEMKLYALTGPCPACNVPIQLAGGAAHELILSCPKCGEKLEVELGADRG